MAQNSFVLLSGEGPEERMLGRVRESNSSGECDDIRTKEKII